jgi:Holliday junction resolvase RusA-like endonuclease
MRFVFFVPGRAVPQGSKTAMISKSTGKPIVVDKDQRLPQWRRKVTNEAIETQAELMQTNPALYEMLPFRGPVGISVRFIMERPKFHYGTGRNADHVKDSAPKYPATMPDIDKMLRAILDALTDAQVWLDDGQVVYVLTTKVYPGNAQVVPGVVVEVGEMR